MSGLQEVTVGLIYMCKGLPSDMRSRPACPIARPALPRPRSRRLASVKGAWAWPEDVRAAVIYNYAPRIPELTDGLQQPRLGSHGL